MEQGWVRATRGPEAEDADLATQLEDILRAVWEAEADWRLCDRIDLAVRLDHARRRAS